jgi:hypothetical protein
MTTNEQQALVAQLKRQAEEQDECAEAYRRRGDDYNAMDCEKNARNIRAHIDFILGED